MRQIKKRIIEGEFEFSGEDTEIVTETTCVCGANLHYWIYEENGRWVHEYFCPNNCGKFQNKKIICGKVIFKKYWKVK